jgi:hypothetical protein
MDAIGNLSGSAARLLLCFLTTDSFESYTELWKRSGIRTNITLEKAEQELQDAGYLKLEDGHFLVNLGKFQQSAV